MPTQSATRTIARNSLWYGAETVVEGLVFLATSIIVARYLGPEKLGQLMFFNFIVSSANRLSGIGLASATRKYMSEYVQAGQDGFVGGIYSTMLRWQSAIAVVIALVGCVAAWFVCEPANRLTAILLFASIAPSLIVWIPSQANNALQEMYRNSPASFVYSAVYAATIGIAVAFKWGMAGVAAGFLAARVAELVVRLTATHRRMGSFPRVPLPPELRHKIRRFCLQGLGLTALAIVVWDRSEIVFLKYFSDNFQLAFYSLGFGLTGRLMVLPSVFGSASSATLMASCSRQDGSASNIFSHSIRYLSLFVLPAHLGAAVLAAAALKLAYGPRFAPAVPAIIICILFAIPRAFQSLSDTVLQAYDRQDYILKWMGGITVLNLALDALLIPHGGAVGAAIANGIAQSIAVVGLLLKARKLGRLHLPATALACVALSALTMAVAVILPVRMLHPAAGLPVGIALGVIVFGTMLRVTRVVKVADINRIATLASRLPQKFQDRLTAFLMLVVNPQTERSVA